MITIQIISNEIIKEYYMMFTRPENTLAGNIAQLALLCEI